MQKRKLPAKYEGDLAKPIPDAGNQRILDLAAHLSGPVKGRASEEKAAQIRRQYEEMHRRMHLLAAHYGRRWPDDAVELAFDLALNHVPGLQIRSMPKRGRRREWTSARLFDLSTTVQIVKETAGLKTDKAACRYIANPKRFEGKWSAAKDTWKDKWVETLESRLHDARKLEKKLRRTR